MDDSSRKQLLLTRIALDRAELRAGAARVHQAIGVPLLWRAVVGADIGRSLFSGGPADAAGWLRAGLALLRRYRWVATVLSGVVPMLRRPGRARKGWRRLARLGAIGVVGLTAWFARRAWRGARAHTHAATHARAPSR